MAFAYGRAVGGWRRTCRTRAASYAYNDSDEVTGIAWKKADGSLIGDLGHYTNGNLPGDGQRTYIWNAHDQLVEIQQGGSIIASFQYDALG